MAAVRPDTIFNRRWIQRISYRDTYSAFFAQSGCGFSVINTQLAMIVHMITTLNNLQAVVKEAACVIADITIFFCLFLIHGRDANN